jgi:VWFA-related protein
MSRPNLRTSSRAIALGLALLATIFTPILAGRAAQNSSAAETADDSPQQPVFRGGTTAVTVDVYPRRDGQVVEGLGPDDFQVFEDGALQRIESFEFIRHAARAVDAELRDPNTVADSFRQAADPRNRLFIIYLDQQHTTFEGWAYGKRPVLEFLRRVIGASDLFATMTPDVPASRLTFGRRTEMLERGLESVWAWEAERRLPRNELEERLWVCDGGLMTLVMLHREDLMFSHLENLMVVLGALRDERKNVLFVGEPWVPSRGAPMGIGSGSPPSGPPRIGTGPDGRLRVGSLPGEADVQWCASQGVRLTQIDFEQRFRDLLTRASRANVSFYPVDVGGLRTGLAGVSAQATFRSMAEQTDGLAIVNTNDLVAGVRRVADSVSAYYRLTYSSTNQTPDGRFRRIEVEVGRPGVSASARRGYVAPTAEMVRGSAAAARAPAEPPPLVAALGELARIRVDARLLTRAVAATSALRVVAELSSREAPRAAWADGADVRVTATGADRFAWSGTGRIAPGTRGVLIDVPVEPTAVGPWQVAVRLSSGSGEVLGDRLQVGRGEPSPLGAPTAYRATPSPRSPLLPVADFTWRRTERARITWALASRPDAWTVRVLDRRGAPTALAPAVDVGETTGALTLSAEFALASMAEGDYVLEAAVTFGDETHRHLLAFRTTR